MWFALVLPFVFSVSAHADLTVGQFVIDASCLEHRADDGLDWTHFPAKADTYVSAAKAVSERMGSCLAGINPDVGDELSRFMRRVGKMRVTCRPLQGGASLECAHVTSGYREIVLTRPNDCGRLDNTLFHELLHLGTSLDGMTAAHHNQQGCRPYDAIYACAEICFPTSVSLHKSGIGWFGCKAAVTREPAAERICSKIPVEFGVEFQDCRPRGY